MTSKHTTSIVDISEIEDDEVLPATNVAGNELALANTSTALATTTNQATPEYHQRSQPVTASNQYHHHNQQQEHQLLEQPQSTGNGSSSQTHLYLYHEDLNPKQPAFTTLAGATGSRSTGTNGSSSECADQNNKANLGTLSGVYFPCVQNIFGVILFIRMVWIVGTAGVPAAFSLVFICCCVTLTTSISLSAIATNGIVPAGGSYHMISRSLGPECGGAVGTLFWFGTTVAGAMYITGAVEIMLNYLAPSWGLFGDFQRDVNIMYNNIRVYGSLLLILVGGLVWVGVKFVSKLAPIALFCVLFSIFSIYAGIFINYNGRSDLFICVVGDRLVTLKNIPYEDPILGNGVFGSSSSATGGGQQMSMIDDYQQQQQQQQHMTTTNNNITRKLSAAELASIYQLRRTKALCTFDKLRYIYCPNEQALQQQQQVQSGSGNDQQEQSAINHHHQQQQQSSMTQQEHEAQMMRDLFKRPPNMSNCDPYFNSNRNKIHLEKAVPGIASGILFSNLKTRFRTSGNVVSYDDGSNTNDKSGFNNVFVDITTSFTILISIYFPSCTGILAGSNRSGDLADAQKSIPRGTIAAQLTTSFVYLSCIVLFGSTFNNLFIRDKFGESMGGQLAVTQIAWPHPYVILIGGLLSTLGASLQSLVGAPRILQGIAKDEVIPCFNRFAKLSPRGEPETAIIFTLAISWFAVLIGNLDFIAPILTISLVMCYFFINLACTLHSLLGSPNWRPRFKHYHWSISTLGCFLCLFVMIVSSWIYFLVATVIACAIYKYIELSGAIKEWGDGKQGLALSAARYNLLRLKTSEPHTKNWRPQLLLFCKLKPSSELEPPSAKINKPSTNNNIYNNKSRNMNMMQQQQQQAIPSAQASSNVNQEQQKQRPQTLAAQYQQQMMLLSSSGVNASSAAEEAAEQLQLVLAHKKLLTFASQLKAGKGLTLVSSIIEGDFKQLAPLAQKARQTLQESMQEERVKGFADVLISPSIQEGLSYQVQTAGLGGLKHNTVIIGWPDWKRRSSCAPTTSTSSSTSSAGKQLSSSYNQKVASNVIPEAASQQQQQQQQQQRGSFKSAATQQQGQQRTFGGHPPLPPKINTSLNGKAHQFIELMRSVQVSQNAFLVVKGVDHWPESCDRLGGYIDIWWIVNDGGLLMLLPHLLKQHRTWKSCQLRIFTVAQETDNSVQMKEDLRKFLYHLRIEAQVDIVEMNNTEISDYAYERTLIMEQRTEIIKRFNVNRRQSLLYEEEIDGVIKLSVRKPSISSFEDKIHSPQFQLGSPINDQHPVIIHQQGSERTNSENYPMVELSSGINSSDRQQQEHPDIQQNNSTGNRHGNFLSNMRPDETNVRRMQTALTLNKAIVDRSKTAKLVIINLPGAPKESTPEAENNCKYYNIIELDFN